MSSTSKFIELDQDRNIYTSGTFRCEEMDFDPGPDTFEMNSLVGGDDNVFISKLDSIGNFIWAKRIGGYSYTDVMGMALDETGAVYLTGYFNDTADFDPSVDSLNMITAGQLEDEDDFFALKLDEDGNLEWAFQLGDSLSDGGHSIVYNAGSIYIAGTIVGIVDVDPGLDTFYINTFGSSANSILLKLDTGGNFIWAKQLPPGASFLSEGNCMTNDQEENLILTGSFTSTVDFDLGPDTFLLSPSGVHNRFILKLNAEGNFIWAKCFSGTNFIRTNSITTDQNGDILMTGAFQDTVDFDPGPLSYTLTTNGFMDIFIQKLDSSGNFLWAKKIGSSGTGNDSGFWVTTDNDNNVYSTGAFQQALDFDPGPDTFTLIGDSAFLDFYVQKLNTNGNFEWAIATGGSFYDIGRSLTLDSDNNLYITGTFSDSVDFDPGTGTFYMSPNPYYQDNLEIFIQKLANCSHSEATDTHTACDSFTWIDGNTYTESNTTTKDTLVNSAGCDSVITLDLTILSTSAIDTIIECASYTWINGITYTESNTTATDTLINTAGCDSVVTLNLTINSITYSTDTHTACDSYTWIDGITYSESNTTAKDTLVNTAGCDSIITLHLTINNPTMTVDSHVACNSFTWIDSVTYTESDTTALDTLLNTLGCDSVISLHLTILPASVHTDTEQACDSITWIDGITYTGNNNSAVHILTNTAGCDSIVSLNLTILESSFSTDVHQACDSFTWIDGITYTESDSIASFVIANSIGCDSVIKLDLVVNYSSDSTIVDSSCFAYSTSNGSNTWIQSGLYFDTLINSSGCDSIVAYDLTIFEVDTIISLNSQQTGAIAQAAPASYQWLNCDSSLAPIPGQTAQYYINFNGAHIAAQITQHGCIDTTACVTIIGVGINESDRNLSLQVYPNPSSGDLTIRTTTILQYATITIHNSIGQLVHSSDYRSKNEFNLNMDTAGGLYMITIHSEYGSQSIPVVFQ